MTLIIALLAAGCVAFLAFIAGLIFLMRHQ